MEAFQARRNRIKVPLQKANAGSLTLQVKKFGLREMDEVPLHTSAGARHLGAFSIRAGDATASSRARASIRCEGLDVNGVRFTPAC